MLRKSAASTATLATAGTESLATASLSENNLSSATLRESLSEASLGTMNLPASVGGDTMVGGAGKDVYVVGDEGATIIDSDGCGTVLYNGKMLAGGIKEKGQSVYTDSSGNSYELDGSNLVINGSLTVENFDTGDMGISLKDEDDPDDSPITTPDIGQNDYGKAKEGEIEAFLDPLVLDMDGDGIELTSLAESSTYFDLSGDGIKEKTGWVNKDDALLVFDKNNNGNIDDITELFGSPTQIGFEVLKGQDTDLNGVIDRNDINFSKLKVWNDLNGNGYAEEGELKTLDEAGVVSIDLNYSSISENVKGNLITESSTYNSSIVMNDGTTRAIVDANFLINEIESQSNSQTAIDPIMA